MKKVIVAAMVIVLGIVSVACTANSDWSTAIADIEDRLAQIEDALGIRHELEVKDAPSQDPYQPPRPTPEEEHSTVQIAVDSMMADKNLRSVAAVTIPTNDMTQFPSTTNPLSDYMRFSTTNGTYTVTAGGTVTQVTTGLIGSQSEQNATQELYNVQVALDSMMADRGLESVTAVTTATNDMTSFPSSTNPLSVYLRQATTNGTYTVTAGGIATQVTTGAE